MQTGKPSEPTTTAKPRAKRMSNPRFVITLEILPRPGGAPAINRLRAFLKAALRQWGIRNQGLEPEHLDDTGDVTPPPGVQKSSGSQARVPFFLPHAF